MSLHTAPSLLAVIERNRRRLWTICYRMTGHVGDADDLSQKSIARAIERGEQVTDADPTGWLIRIATTTCLDHLRRGEVRRRVTELVDPIDLAGIEAGEVEALAALLAEEAWGVVDGGGVVPAASRPSFGRRSVVRRFANAWGKLERVALEAELRCLNAEPAVVVRVAGAPTVVVAVIHVETRAGKIAALRIDRDPRRTRAFALAS